MTPRTFWGRVNKLKGNGLTETDICQIKQGLDCYDALKDLVQVIAIDQLIPESVSYMKQARAALTWPTNQRAQPKEDL